MTAGFGVREVMVTVGIAPPALTVIDLVAAVELAPRLSCTIKEEVKVVVVVTV